MSEGKKKSFSKRRIALICSIVVSVFFVLLILGKPFLFPLPPSIRFDAPVGAYFGEDAAVIADQAGERLLFLDGERRLRGIVKLGDDAEVNRAALFADDGEHFFAAGYKFEKDKDVVSSFRIIRMARDGRDPTVVLDLANENGMETNIVLDITAFEGRLYIVRDDLAAGTVIVTEHHIESGSTEDILTTHIPADYTAKYDPRAERLYVNDYYGRIFVVSAEQPEPEQILEDYIVENYLPTDDGGLFWIDSIHKSLYKNEQLLLEDTGAYYTFFPCKEGVAFDNAADSRLSVFDLAAGTVSPIYGAEFSASYLLFSAGCTVCILYLGVLLLILLVRAIRNMYLAKNYVNIKRTGIVAVLIASACIISLMYTDKIIDIENRHTQEDILLYSHYFAESVDRQLLEEAVYTPDVGKDQEAWQKYLTAYGKLENEYGFFSERMDESRKNGYLSIYKKLDDALVLVFETDAVTHFGYQYHYADFTSLIDNDAVERFTKAGYNKYHGMAPITDGGGEIIGAVEYGQDYRLTNADIRTTCIDMIVRLLSVFAIIYIILIELIEFFKNRSKRNELIRQGTHPHPEITMIRNATFLLYSIAFIDSIVIVFVAKHLLQASGMQETSFRLALPSLMDGIGLVVSCFTFNLIAGRVCVKRLARISGIATLLVRVGLCAAVFSGNFVLFCLMNLLSFLFIPFLLCIIQTMRVKANDESERYYCSRQFSLGRVSGIMMGALISGFVVQEISRTVILYAISAVLVIPLLLLLSRILPDKTIYVTSSGEKNMTRSKGKLGFLFDKSIIAYFLFAMIPMYLIMGYQGYLFPLYSDRVRMPTMYVTTAFVMSRALLFMLSDSIESLLKRIDHWKTIIYSIGLIGIAFLEFAVNSGIIWAMIMLVITGAAETVVMPAREVVWSRQARATGVPLESASANMGFAHELICALKETMVSVFLLLGNNSACIALGAFCLVSIVIFMFCTRKKAMASAA